MKATFQIPDELYREVKAQTAREGRTIREVAISLFEQWLKQKRQPAPGRGPRAGAAGGRILDAYTSAWENARNHPRSD